MSSHQANLALGIQPIVGERTEPRLWVKEFCFYSDFKPEAEVRHISLKRGLNIIWAKESAEGAAGHAAGKSTFCRLLRYLIGDESYGSEEFRPALRTKFPDAIIAGEIILNGESWLLCRSLSESGTHWAARGQTFADLFATGFKKEHYKEFTKELEQTFISPLGLQSYPGSERGPEWPHLLQWLTRDQDARYAHPLVWREGSESKFPTKSDKANLIRLVLGVLGATELEKQKSHSALLTRRAELKTEIPKLAFARDRTVKDLRTIFPELAGNNDLEFRLEELKTKLTQNLASLRTEQKSASLTDGVGDELAAILKSKTSTRDSRQRESEACETEIKRLQSKLDYRNGKLSKEEHREQLSELGAAKGLCSESIEDAIACGCPLAPAPNRDEMGVQRMKDAKTMVDQLDNGLAFQKERKARIHTELTAAKNALTPIAEKAEQRKKDHTSKIETRADSIIALTQRITPVNSALQDTVQLRTDREEQQTINGNVDDSNQVLPDFRTSGTQLLSNLRNDYSHVASVLLQQQIDGKVQFTSDGLKTSLDYSGDMSSAALVTLRLLIFDLASLLGSARTTSHHPGFLLHDSPREADLSATIYRRLFTLIASEQENESVQYIIATTEPPPPHLQKSPWLVCDPLSSDSPTKRLLRAII